MSGLDSDRGCRTGGHAEACGCCLLNTTSRVRVRISSRVRVSCLSDIVRVVANG